MSLKKIPLFVAAGTAALLTFTGCAATAAQTKAESCAVIAKQKDLSPNLKSQESIQKAIDAYTEVKSKIGYKDVSDAVDSVVGSLQKSKEQLTASEELTAKVKKEVADGTFDPKTLDEFPTLSAEEMEKMQADAAAVSEICNS